MINEIKELLHRQPFEPFVIQMADGRRFTVPHPEWAMPHPTLPTSVVVPMPSGGFQILSVRHIASLDDPTDADLAKLDDGRGSGSDDAA